MEFFFFFFVEKNESFTCVWLTLKISKKHFFVVVGVHGKLLIFINKIFHSQKENLNGKKFSVWAIGSLKWENMTQIWYLLKKIDGKAVCLSEKRLFVKKVNSWTTLIVYTLGSMGQAGWVFSQPITDLYKIRWVVF